MGFDIIKRNYERKLWNKELVKAAVRKGAITKGQYEEITGEKYMPSAHN